MAELPAFKEELQCLFLPLLDMETLHTFKDYELHEALINLIDCLFIFKGNNLITNIQLISEAVAALIDHEETRISQKAISVFERLIRVAIETEPTIIKATGEQL